VTGGGQRRGGRVADAAVAAGDDDPHVDLYPLTGPGRPGGLILRGAVGRARENAVIVAIM